MTYKLQPNETQDHVYVTVPEGKRFAEFTCADPLWSHVVFLLRFKLGTEDALVGGGVPSPVNAFGKQHVHPGQRWEFGLRSGAAVPVAVDLVFS